jgi:2-keto-myo-inositol isomerase
MKRRGFLKSAAGGAGAALGVLGATGGAEAAAPSSLPFTLCINQATTRKTDFRTAMDAYAKAGFRQVELWLDSVEPFLQKESTAAARRVMADHGLEPVSSCCEEDLFFPQVAERERKLEGFKRKLDLSARLGAHRFVMYSAISEGVSLNNYPSAVPGLHEIGELGRQFEVVVGIEFIAGAKFLGCLETTASLLRRVGHPNLGVLLDTFHFYAGISKIEDIENLRRGEISFVHIDDVPAMPRELLEDQHRVYVGDGVIPQEKILRALSRVYQGPLSFEVFQYADQDPAVVARKGFEGLSRLLAGLQGGQ